MDQRMNPEDLQREFRFRLSALIRLLGEDPSQVAATIGVRTSELNRYLYGKHLPAPKILLRIFQRSLEVEGGPNLLVGRGQYELTVAAEKTRLLGLRLSRPMD